MSGSWGSAHQRFGGSRGRGGNPRIAFSPRSYKSGQIKGRPTTEVDPTINNKGYISPEVPLGTLACLVIQLPRKKYHPKPPDTGEVITILLVFTDSCHNCITSHE